MSHLLVSLVIGTCAISVLVAHAVKPHIESVNTTLDRVASSLDRLFR
jgi:hypothetical protein